jgi:hypothetical protein
MYDSKPLQTLGVSLSCLRFFGGALIGEALIGWMKRRLDEAILVGRSCVWMKLHNRINCELNWLIPSATSPCPTHAVDILID